MNPEDEALLDLANSACASGKPVMVAIRGMSATPINAIERRADGMLLTLSCPGDAMMGLGPSRLTIRASDLLGVSVAG